MRPLCTVCNQRPRAINLIRNGKTYYLTRCQTCIRKKRKAKPQQARWESKGYKKKPACDKCGFRARFGSQLVVYHVDGNLNNPEIRNLKTVCLNCVEEIKRSDVTWRPGDLTPDF